MKPKDIPIFHIIICLLKNILGINFILTKFIGDEMQEDYTFRTLKFTFKVDNELLHKFDIGLNAVMQKKYGNK